MLRMPNWSSVTPGTGATRTACNTFIPQQPHSLSRDDSAVPGDNPGAPHLACSAWPITGKARILPVIAVYGTLCMP